MEHLKEFEGLPKELYEWGQETVSKIKSPEKRHEVAAELRVHIDEMWNDNWQLEENKRVKWIIDNLGEASSLGILLEKEEKYDPYAFRRYFILAAVLLVLGATIGGISISRMLTGTDVINDVMPGWYTGKYTGAGAAAGIFLFVAGIGTLRVAIRTKKEQKQE